MEYYRDRELLIRPLEEEDCPALAAAFAAQGWNKPQSQYEGYLREQRAEARQVLTALWQGDLAGYVTLLPKAPAGPFAGKEWPEIADFNVLRAFQRRGIGGKLLDAAEQLAAQVSGTVCLGVGMHPGYGAAQRLYVKRGYVPDGSGLWYRDSQLASMASCQNDDDLVLYLSKPLQKRELRLLQAEEIDEKLFAYFNRFQVVEQCWRKTEGRWAVKDIAFTERWSEQDYQFLARCLRRTAAAGGAVWGGFLNGRLKGFASVEKELLGSGKQYADLSSIHVSTDARDQGLGRLLFQKAAQSGRQLGGEKLYISAHSCVESQSFYRRMGCVEAQEYDAHHVEQEPCDCQLEYPIGAQGE